MTRYCPTCGVDVPRPTARFCDYCGAHLAETTAEAAAPPASAEPPAATGREATAALSGPPERHPETQALSQPSQTATDHPPSTADPSASSPSSFSSSSSPASDSPASGPSPTNQKLNKFNPKTIHERYHLLDILGQGGFGAVYLAQDRKLERLCVVKQMRLKSKSAKKLEMARANFEREARLLVQLNQPGQPNIPEIYDYFSEDEDNYLVMKYIEGRSLHQILKQGDPLPPAEIIRHAVDLCRALDYMHTHFDEPIMHRDIKPANILLGNNDHIWLVDFGLAKAHPVASGENGDEAAVTHASGSVGYTPLEQWLGEPQPASDIYALGATLHHLLTSLDPLEAFGREFNIVKLQQQHAQFIPLRKANPDLPEALEGIIASATGADPDQRPTARQMMQQLQAFTTGADDLPLFTFQDGTAAHNVGQLVDLCDAHRREAQGYLYRRDFERWFRLINRHDLAEAAQQAIKQSHNQRAGLEKFLRLILPNLFRRRLGRAGWRLGRAALRFGITAAVVLLLLVIGASFVARLILWQSISNYDWNFAALQTGQVTTYPEAQLNQIADDNLDFLFNRVVIDTEAPNRINLQANWGGLILLETALTVDLVEGAPRIDLSTLNGLSLPLIAHNLSQGINAGLAAALREASLEITHFDIKDTALLLGLTGPGQSPAEPPPQVHPPSLELSNLPDHAAEVTHLIVFNELEREVILEIDGESWTLRPLGAEVIRLAPGRHTYAIKYDPDGPPVGSGQRQWVLDRYQLTIDQTADFN